jgi:hypothetical protein
MGTLDEHAPLNVPPGQAPATVKTYSFANECHVRTTTRGNQRDRCPFAASGGDCSLQSQVNV